MITIPEVPLRHQQLIVTLYGLYGRQAGGSFPVSVLISMLGDLGHDAPVVRSSVSRLKARGVLRSVRTESGPGYAISADALEIFSAGDQRIFSYARAEASDPWILALFSVPEALRDRRHQLRNQLTALGFGMVSSGVWIAPARVREETVRRLESSDLSPYVELFEGTYGSEVDMHAKLRQWWDLDKVDAQFTEFVDLYGKAMDEWTTAVGSDPTKALAESTEELRREAFRYYVPLLTLWRRFPYRDPGLPLAYLPEDWKGPRAGHLFRQLHALVGPLAAEYARSLIETNVKVPQPA